MYPGGAHYTPGFNPIRWLATLFVVNVAESTVVLQYYTTVLVYMGSRIYCWFKVIKIILGSLFTVCDGKNVHCAVSCAPTQE